MADLFWELDVANVVHLKDENAEEYDSLVSGLLLRILNGLPNEELTDWLARVLLAEWGLDFAPEEFSGLVSRARKAYETNVNGALP